jgi:hypothetical protein
MNIGLSGTGVCVEMYTLGLQYLRETRWGARGGLLYSVIYKRLTDTEQSASHYRYLDKLSVNVRMEI